MGEQGATEAEKEQPMIKCKNGYVGVTSTWVLDKL